MTNTINTEYRIHSGQKRALGQSFADRLGERTGQPEDGVAAEGGARGGALPGTGLPCPLHREGERQKGKVLGPLSGPQAPT